MPIENNVKIQMISEHDFYQFDYKVMGIAYSIHNDFGKFWDEKIYKNELLHRCVKAGFEKARIEVPIEVSFKDFKKTYFIDLLINDAIIYELKTVKALSGEHQRQTLNYLFLMGAQNGKLVNFRSQSVEYRFVSTTITPEDRFDFIIDHSQWSELDEDSCWIKDLLIRLIHEWGVYIDTNLFVNAIIHFRGGEEIVVNTIKVTSNSTVVGHQKVNLLNPQIAFKISSITKDFNFYEKHLYRFIRHTNLRALQWINFNHKRVEFKTIIA